MCVVVPALGSRRQDLASAKEFETSQVSITTVYLRRKDGRKGRKEKGREGGKEGREGRKKERKQARTVSYNQCQVPAGRKRERKRRVKQPVLHGRFLRETSCCPACVTFPRHLMSLLQDSLCCGQVMRAQLSLAAAKAL